MFLLICIIVCVALFVPLGIVALIDRDFETLKSYGLATLGAILIALAFDYYIVNA